MKLIVEQSKLTMNPDQFLRKTGYGYIRDRRNGHESYVRRLGNDFYPRLHMYYEEGRDQVIFNLHLDQKQASYEGAAHMHNADHDGPVVTEEINRLKRFVEYFASQVPPKVVKEEKKSWWKIFS